MRSAVGNPGRLILPFMLSSALSWNAWAAPVSADAVVRITPALAPKAAAGTFVTWAYQVENSSPESLAVQVAILPPSGWAPVSAERAVTLAPGEVVTVPFTVWVPPTAPADSLHRMPARVSSATGALLARVVRVIEVARTHNISVSVTTPTLSGKPGKRVHHLFRVTNTGNTTDTFELSATSVPQWQAKIPESRVTLSPGESRDVTVTLSIPPSASAGEFHLLTVTAGLSGPPEDEMVVSSNKSVATVVHQRAAELSRYRRLPVSATVSTEARHRGENPLLGLRAFTEDNVSGQARVRLEMDVVSLQRDAGDRAWESRRVRLQVKGERWETTLGDAQADFPDVATRTLWGRGLSFRSHGDRWSTRLFASPEWLSGGLAPSTHTSWGAGVERRIGTAVWVEADAIHKEPLSTYSGSDWQRDLACVAARYAPHANLQLKLEGGWSDSDTEHGVSRGTAAQLLADYKGADLDIRTRCYTGTDGYSGRYHDRDGAVGFVRYSLGRSNGRRSAGHSLALWTSADISTGRSGESANSPQLLTARYRTGGQFSGRSWPTLELAAGGELDREGVGGRLRHLEQRHLSLAMWHTLRRLMISVSGRWGKAFNRIEGGRGDIFSYGIGLGGRIGGIRTVVRWSLDREEVPDRRFRVDSSSWLGDFSWTSGLGGLILGLGASSRSYKLAAAAGSERRENRLQPRIDWRVRQGLNLRLEAGLRGMNEPLDVDRWQLELTWNSRDAVPAVWAPVRSGVRGVVFLDENLDGLPSEGERRIGGVSLVLDAMQRLSEEDGKFEYGVVVPGVYWLDLNRGSLPRGLVAMGTFPLAVQVEPGDEVMIPVALVQSCELSGRIFHDKDYDTAGSEGESGLPDLRVDLLRDGEEAAERLTDPAGQYRFRGIPPGEYIVRIAENWLPPGWIPTGDVEVRISLRPGARSEIQPFGVAPKRKPIVRTFHDGRLIEDSPPEIEKR